VVFNQLGFKRSDVVEFILPMGWDSAEISESSESCEGFERILPSQIVESINCDEQKFKKVIFFAENIPAKGYKVFKIKNVPKVGLKSESFTVETHEISNKFFKVKFDDAMNIESIYDRQSGREVLKAGQKANVLQAFEDRPHNFDAWEIKMYYQEKMWEINDVESVEIIERGPVRASIKINRKFVDSSLTQFIYAYNDIPRIDFSSIVDWKETQILLKAAFPVDIHSDKASYEIQYGNVERPTHWNTSWDYARFEVCAQKWADLSEDGYGVSLMNDCKYGYDIKDSIMRLTLIKSATYPNEDADREIHEFTYSLYPHAGGWRDAGTVQMAYSLNCPMYAKVSGAHKGDLPLEFSLVNLDKDNVIIEVVKKAEDSEDIIIRLYECYNRRTDVNLTFTQDLTEACECDLLEKGIGEIDFSGRCFKFRINPYEIKTFKVKLTPGPSPLIDGR
jgi:alpha-mannosidase